jgi:hypothetical protein
VCARCPTRWSRSTARCSSSTTLLYADIAVDVAVDAALLRHLVDPVDAVSTDPYNVQRFEYSEYIDNACTARPSVRPMG